MTLTQQIRQEIKEQLGYNSRQVSVREQPGGLSTSISITLKKPDLDFDKIKSIADSHKSIGRCERTGEILSGGNTYVHVNKYREDLIGE
jgi:hypothetical protein